MREKVFVLYHVRPDDEYADDFKLIGIYKTKRGATAAIKRVADQPGFRDYPLGFEIHPYELGKDHWTEGFGFVSDDEISN
ncbi:hypothetical protein [Iodidimonas sp. SYSU 1G8]|uniref:DUF7336 domain-containing protein n=1 Tax=Iodidimonas sp. SYSU 1G8 TaxID=3133967 RepID=UPI0031FF45F5